MIRGEYEVNGVIVLNHFTNIGMQTILRAAFWQEPVDLWIGLCAKNPGDAVALSQLNEPTIGVNGYARQAVPMNKLNWAALGLVNGESYVRSRTVVFPFTGAPYDSPFNRLFMTDGTYVISISSPLESGLGPNDEDIATNYTCFFR